MKFGFKKLDLPCLMSLSVYSLKFNIIYLPGHIATASYNLVIVEEPTATEVASVSRKFPADPNIAFASFQAENLRIHSLFLS